MEALMIEGLKEPLGQTLEEVLILPLGVFDLLPIGFN